MSYYSPPGLLAEIASQLLSSADSPSLLDHLSTPKDEDDELMEEPTASTSTLPPSTAGTSQQTPRAAFSALPASRSTSESPGAELTPTGKVKKARRSKVAEACKFCRKSHMSCDAGRPCSRCVKRGIAHLCREELGGDSPGPPPSSSSSAAAAAATATNAALSPLPSALLLSPVPNNMEKTLSGNLLGLQEGSLPALPTPAASTPSAGTNGNATASGSGSRPSTNGARGYSSNETTGSSRLGGNAFGASSSSSAFDNHQAPMLSSNFNLAMLDLASGQDGMGADLGLGDYTLGGKDMMGGEFQGLELSDFLQSLHENSFADTHLSPPYLAQPLPISSHLAQLQNLNHTSTTARDSENILRETNDDALGLLDGMTSHATISDALNPNKMNGGASRDSHGLSAPTSPLNKTERFLLTAADQKDGSRSDRLARVIHAKFEAGLLRPYNHVAGYTRLMRWMADNMSPTSRQRTLHTLSEFRPAFRAVASGLTDLDLVFIEEAFERLLLDYDRVFSSMGIPSCLWRRTGEIYKGNKEFAALVGVPIEQLRDGKLAIYELMAEESAVNYWEKYGNIAFDAGQKAVLTSCVLVNQTALSRKRKKAGGDREKEKARHREDAMINCCFSFTVRRDSYAIPSMIVGNFLRF